MNLRYFIFPPKYPFCANEWYVNWSRYRPNPTTAGTFACGKHAAYQGIFEDFQKFVVKEQVNEHPKDDIQTDDG